MEGLLGAYMMQGSVTHIEGGEYVKIWNFTTRTDAQQEKRYWESRGFLARVRPEPRGFALFASPQGTHLLKGDA
jgi:hypothetical protein